ncbi:unnamed protein product [Coregonus sp. 'balchen']|nr:unnamed protein product [Coregonus sp. 'balchen']
MEALGMQAVYNKNYSRLIFGKFIQSLLPEVGTSRGMASDCLLFIYHITTLVDLERGTSYLLCSLAGADKTKSASVNNMLSLSPVVSNISLSSLNGWSEHIVLFTLSSFVSNISVVLSQVMVSNVSDLLGLDSFQLSEVLTQRSMILRGEEICSPLTVEQNFRENFPLEPAQLYYLAVPESWSRAVDSRDSVAMALYSQSFSWIITRINQKVRGKDNFKSIGILDIFGFENFEVALCF